MDVQLRTLILEPCRMLQDPTPSILLIDGLDECEGHNIQREILWLIGSAAQDHGRQLRILVASRPEPHIRETLEDEPVRELVGFIDRSYLKGASRGLHFRLQSPTTPSKNRSRPAVWVPRPAYASLYCM
ncbi:hypothetical protein B0H14DRAFT_2702779, partial [Mycena olivaceomarginata]